MYTHTHTHTHTHTTHTHIINKRMYLYVYTKNTQTCAGLVYIQEECTFIINLQNKKLKLIVSDILAAITTN